MSDQRAATRRASEDQFLRLGGVSTRKNCPGRGNPELLPRRSHRIIRHAIVELINKKIQPLLIIDEAILLIREIERLFTEQKSPWVLSAYEMPAGVRGRVTHIDFVLEY